MNRPSVVVVVCFEIPGADTSAGSAAVVDSASETVFSYLRETVGGPDARTVDPCPFPWHIRAVEIRKEGRR